MTNAAPTGKGNFALPDAVYEVGKEVALIYLPALAVLYTALATIYGWGFIAQVNGTVIAVDTFLGVVLKISQVSYDKSAKSVDGTLNVDQTGLTDKYSLDITKPLAEITDSAKLTLAVDNTPKMDTTQTPIVQPVHYEPTTPEDITVTPPPSQ